jgi:hypothetical protein
MVNNEKEIPKDRIKSATNSPKRGGGQKIDVLNRGGRV